MPVDKRFVESLRRRWMTYDSRPDTWEHIATVRRYISRFILDLQARGDAHDKSKLESPELEVFDRVTPRLKELKYPSPEYAASLAEMGEGLAHHYAMNRHHPEHHENGIRDMTLVDVVEMLCDWKAASERHPDGDVLRSIEEQQSRFGYSDELKAILTNTAIDMWGGAQL